MPLKRGDIPQDVYACAEGAYRRAYADGASSALSRSFSAVFGALSEMPDSRRQQLQRRAAANAFMNAATAAGIPREDALVLLRRASGQRMHGEIGDPL